MIFHTLTSSIKWLFLAHAFAGATALLVFLIPLLSKKGGKLHVRVGWVYVGAMVFVGLSAFVITPWRFFFDPEKTSVTERQAAFLFYIAIFTLSAIAHGLMVFKEKNRAVPSRKLAHIALPAVTILVGLATQLMGYLAGSVLLMAFPFLGHLTAYGQLKYWLHVPTERMHWWYEHMTGMVTACIATITAFLVTALPRLWPSPISESPVLWIAPGLILGTILNRWVAKSRLQYEGAGNK